MRINTSNIYSNYSNYYNNQNSMSEISRKRDLESNHELEDTQNKLSYPGEVSNIRTDTIQNYTKYLTDKYSYFNTTSTIEGISTTVSISPTYIKKCVKDSEKCSSFEKQLDAIPECIKIATSRCLGTLTNITFKIDDNGKATMIISGSSDPDGKIAKENAEKKAKERKEKEKKTKEIQTEKRRKDHKINTSIEENLIEKYNKSLIVKDGFNNCG